MTNYALHDNMLMCIHYQTVPTVTLNTADASFYCVGWLQMDANTLSALSSNIISKLSSPIPVLHSWGPALLGAQVIQAISFVGAASKLEACGRASASQLQVHVAPGATPDAESLAGLSTFVSKGVITMEVVWGAEGPPMGTHLQALGAVVGQSITHLKLSTISGFTDDAWSGLWTAFPNLRCLRLYTPDPGSSTALLQFCAAAPHALELQLPTTCYNTIARHLEAGLHSTRGDGHCT
jgi:hypothetical protein